MLKVSKRVPVEAADSTVGRGYPEQASPILVNVLHLHPGQTVGKGVTVS